MHNTVYSGYYVDVRSGNALSSVCTDADTSREGNLIRPSSDIIEVATKSLDLTQLIYYHLVLLCTIASVCSST